MKTRPDLLVRDALAATFVAAAHGDVRAGDQVRALAAWSAGGGPSGPPDPAAVAGLVAITTEPGTPIFTSGGCVADVYAAEEPYIRDRALRMGAALGWILADGTAGDVLEASRAAWDAGLFFEVHELLEPAWLAAEEPRKSGLQSLILAGVALHHLTNANLAGARSLLRRAVDHITASPRASGRDLSDFGRGLAALSADLDAGRVTHAGQVTDLPHF